MEGFSEFTAKSGQFRNRMNFWFGSLQPGEKVAAGIIAVNVAVFLLWRVAPATVMYKWFAASPYTTTSCWPMLFSSFSHYSPLHILANMCVLWSFAAPVSHRLGPEQLLAFYLSAGVVSVFGSYAFKIARMTAVPSLGASGAICGLIGYQCWVNPESQLAILFVNQIIPHSFSAKSGLIALMTFDLMGIVFRWKVLDHAGHLAGVLFGIFYANYAQTLWSKRVSFVKWYHGIRNKFS
ncbi:hypothetical protein CAPTEDRAFT_153017 [Capitella teleta]|uniref:rhomboid protease n=1 Tax=Capitella teleta TaxID=283909 RepID=R7T6W9_CAPTE|nr:hypothetical protein CAPTEDRAFT_153017 [Capitella teleta]|eukprot:ELT89143.1 hypothetical protein CAPTEDRAFT_153017 [Capitella teleta]